MSEREEVYKKLKKNGNFCGMTKVTYEKTVGYMNFLRDHSEISGGRFKDFKERNKKTAKAIHLKTEDAMKMRDFRCIVRSTAEFMFSSGIGYNDVVEELKIAFIESQERFIKKEGTW